MSLTAAIGDFLRQQKIPYTTFTHRVAYTAQEEAAAAHVPARQWAKIVVCFADGEPVQAVLPANHMVDLDALRALAGAAETRLGTEPEIASLYPECEPGGMPPFGPLYGQRVFVDESLVGEPDMVFNGGTHVDAIRMHYNDFAELVQPVVGRFARLLHHPRRWR